MMQRRDGGRESYVAFAAFVSLSNNHYVTTADPTGISNIVTARIRPVEGMRNERGS